MEVRIVRVGEGAGLPLPSYATPQSSGLDLYSAVDVVLKAGSRAMVNTGIAIELPNAYEAQVRSRSGLAAKFGVIVLNSPGTIDADYRGEIIVILANFGDKDYAVKRGDRIAQLVISPVERVTLKEVDTITDTSRGDGGFGSTGT
ncbi:dUTP diphosphatase [Anaplasma bovis]|uniref:dUTP diphosphatase n=1 Tax=Anaplasma bovis TaxID=186733 RepID=UPI002FEF6BCA